MVTCIVIKRKHIFIFTFALMCLISGFIVSNRIIGVFNSNEEVYIALIIDDFGNNTEGTQKFKNLSIPFTAAVMPAMPDSVKESMFFTDSGKDVILHMPMESKTGSVSWLGPNALTTDLTDDEIRRRIEISLDELHGVVGINNHMGSKAMENERIVGILFEIAKERNLIVIDSKTTPLSLPRKTAHDYGVTTFERDIFLDSVTKDFNTIKKNLDKAAKIAKKYGYAVAIGHVGNSGGSVTANAINEKATELEQQNIKFVTVTELKKILDDKKIS